MAQIKTLNGYSLVDAEARESINTLTINKLDAAALPEAIEDAVGQLQASGSFKGEKGEAGENGVGIASITIVEV